MFSKLNDGDWIILRMAGHDVLARIGSDGAEQTLEFLNEDLPVTPVYRCVMKGNNLIAKGVATTKTVQRVHSELQAQRNELLKACGGSIAH